MTTRGSKYAIRLAWLLSHRDQWQDIPAVALHLWTNDQRLALQALMATMRSAHVLALPDYRRTQDPIGEVLRAIRHIRDDLPPTDTVESLQGDADRLMPPKTPQRCGHCGEAKTDHRLVNGGIYICPGSVFVPSPSAEPA